MKRETGGGDNSHQPICLLGIPEGLLTFQVSVLLSLQFLDEKTEAQGDKVTCLRLHTGRTVHSDPLWTWLLSQGWEW